MAGLALAVAPSALAAPRAQILRGLAVAQTHCATCHAVGAEDTSPQPSAPAFRELHTRYPVADLIAAVAEGASTGHPAMPRFHLRLRQRRDLAAYVRSLEP
jgi:cytochrome c